MFAATRAAGLAGFLPVALLPRVLADVQEADHKWKDVKNKYKNIQLHMLGKLQTNKAKIAVKIFRRFKNV